MNSLYPIGSDYQLLVVIIIVFVVLIFLTYFKSPRNTYTYIVIVILVLAGGWISYFQYNSEKLANYTETNWKEDREYQVYRLRDMILKKEMKNLTENEIKYLLGKPEEIVKKNKGKRYEYIYQGTWGIHE